MFTDHKPGREMDDTAASAADDRLEEMLKQIKARGGKITRDEETPLHIDFNNEVVDIGTRRVIEFLLKGTEFQITRDVKNMRVGGAGHHKHLEQSMRPMIETKLKKRPESEETWLAVDVDIEDLF